MTNETSLPTLHREPIEADREAVIEAVIAEAEQACRYVAKHNVCNMDAGEYRDGFEDGSEVCKKAIADHVRRHIDRIPAHRLAFSTPAAAQELGGRYIVIDRDQLTNGHEAFIRGYLDQIGVKALSTPAASDAEAIADHLIGKKRVILSIYDEGFNAGLDEAVDLLRALPLPKAGEMETETAFEIWEDDLMVASASTEAEGLHYFAVYSQDGPVKLVRAETVRQVIATPSTEGRKGEDQADG